MLTLSFNRYKLKLSQHLARGCNPQIYTQQTQNICIAFVQRRSNVVQRCSKVKQMFCVYLVLDER